MTQQQHPALTLLNGTLTFAAFKKLNTSKTFENPENFNLSFVINCVIQTHNTPLLRKLLVSGLDVNGQFETPEIDLLLSVMTSKASLPCVELLIDAGAYLENRSSLGRTPLLMAARMNYVEIFKRLLNADANLYASYQQNHDTLNVLSLMITQSDFIDKFHFLQQTHGLDVNHLAGIPELFHMAQGDALDLLIHNVSSKTLAETVRFFEDKQSQVTFLKAHKDYTQTIFKVKDRAHILREKKNLERIMPKSHFTEADEGRHKI